MGGEGFEVLIYLALMAFIALRTAMQKKQRDRMKGEDPADRAERLEMPESMGQVGRTPPGRRRRQGFLERLQEMAEQMEREAEARAEAARDAFDDLPRENVERVEGDDDEYVLVRGRQVFPRQASTEPHPVPDRESHWSDWQDPATSNALHGRRSDSPGVERRHSPHDATPERPGGPPERPARRKAAGLSKVDRYGPLQRAILLTEVLGPPPGLDGVAPAERRLDQMD